MDLRKIITWRILKGNFRYCFRSFLFVLLCVLWLILPSNPLKILLVFSEEKATWMNLLKHLDSEFEVNRTKNSKRNAWNYLLNIPWCSKNFRKGNTFIGNGNINAYIYVQIIVPNSLQTVEKILKMIILFFYQDNVSYLKSKFLMKCLKKHNMLI